MTKQDEEGSLDLSRFEIVRFGELPLGKSFNLVKDNVLKGYIKVTLETAKEYGGGVFEFNSFQDVLIPIESKFVLNY